MFRLFQTSNNNSRTRQGNSPSSLSHILLLGLYIQQTVASTTEKSASSAIVTFNGEHTHIANYDGFFILNATHFDAIKDASDYCFKNAASHKLIPIFSDTNPYHQLSNEYYLAEFAKQMFHKEYALINPQCHIHFGANIRFKNSPQNLHPAAIQSTLMFIEGNYAACIKNILQDACSATNDDRPSFLALSNMRTALLVLKLLEISLSYTVLILALRSRYIKYIEERQLHHKLRAVNETLKPKDWRDKYEGKLTRIEEFIDELKSQNELVTQFQAFTNKYKCSITLNTPIEPTPCTENSQHHFDLPALIQHLSTQIKNHHPINCPNCRAPLNLDTLRVNLTMQREILTEINNLTDAINTYEAKSEPEAMNNQVTRSFR